MSISEKIIIPLSLEECEGYTPKKEKEKNSLNLPSYIDLNNIDEEDLMKLKNIPLRKSSTCSTSASKPGDSSEIYYNIDSPISTPLNSHQYGIFFSSDRNCSNPIINFYQTTEEYIRETHPESDNYKKTRNYISKNIIKNNYIISEVKIDKTNQNTTSDINCSLNNSNNPKNDSKTVPAAPIIFFGGFAPKLNNGGKGKFDLPISYVNCFGWNSKFII